MIKIKRAVCAVLSAALLISCLPLVAAAETPPEIPIVECRGAFHPLYFNAGTPEQTVGFSGTNNSVFAADLLAQITDALSPLLADVQAGNLNIDIIALADSLGEVINRNFGVLAFQPDGTPINKLDGDINGNNWYLSPEHSGRAYSFDFDWRESPLITAERLNAFIKEVKTKTGSDTVNLCVQSGSAPLGLAYLYQYGTSDLSAYWARMGLSNGSTLFGQMVNKGIRIDGDALFNCTYLEQFGFGGDDEQMAQITEILRLLNDLGILHMLTGLAYLPLRPTLIDRLYEICVIPTLLTMPILWAYVPEEFYESGIETCFGGERAKYAGLIAKLEEYYNVQRNGKAILAKAAKEIRVGLSCSYGSSLVPLVKGANTNSDTLVDIALSSYGATASVPGEALDGPLRGLLPYVQKVKDGHNHISPDNQIDASTCLLPETTWFYDSATHFSMIDYELRDWFFDYADAPTVHSDPEKHPQFLHKVEGSSSFDPLVPLAAPEPEALDPTQQFLDLLKSAVRGLLYVFNWWLDYV
ncbi:MAG: hypothetical protein LBQ33_01915 [Oscillospiraceae bacterium]|jgi:hypothetical protein|nr:hypothetical protein [Oscillospiraceae bacterium]